MTMPMSNFKPEKNLVWLPWLDPVKGLAILGIMLYHAELYLFDLPPFDHPKDYWMPLGERLLQLQPWLNDSLMAFIFMNAYRYLGWLGYQGVHLFLVLSGFGLTWSQLRYSPAEGVNLPYFYRRRLWRIFPLYWAGHLFFLLFFAIFEPPGISLLDSRFYLSLVGVRFLSETFFYISPAWWYVGLIIQLYLIFPLLWMWLLRKGLFHFWLGTAAITLLSRFGLLVMVGGQHIEMWSMGAIFVTRLFEFTFGMGLAYWLAQQPDGLERLWQKRWPLLLACLTYLVALVLSFTVIGSVVAHSLIAVSLFGITFALSRYGLIRLKLLGQSTAWLGQQSYGLMILHQPLLLWFISLGKSQGYAGRFLLPMTILVLFLILPGSAAFSALVERVTTWVSQAVSILRQFAVNRRAAQKIKHET